MKEDELEILEEFVQESREHLAAIEPDLLEMERLGSSTASDIVNRVFRAIHSTKGGAAFLAFESLKEFSHVMENVLMLIRDKKLEIAPDVIDALLRGVDILRRMVDDVRSSDLVDCTAERAALEALLSPTSATKAAHVAPAAAASRGPSIAPAVFKTSGDAEVERLGATVEPERLEAILEAIREAIAHGKRIYRLVLSDEADLAAQKLTVEQFESLCTSVGKVLFRHSDVLVATDANRAEHRHTIVLASVLDRHLLAPALGLPEGLLYSMDRNSVLTSTALSEALRQVPAAAAWGEMKVSKRPGEGPVETWPTVASPIEQGTPSIGVKAPVAPIAAKADGVSIAPVMVARAVEVDSSGKPSVASALASVSQGSGGMAASSKESSSDATETLRVRVELLNQLMDSASELVLGRNQLLRALKDQADKSTGLGIILQHIDRVTTDLQERIMQTRMQQIGSLFGRFARVARDLGRQLGKNVELRSEGNHVELDKSIIEALVDPLTHIVRNAVDHAIETPEERRKRKKPEVGRILLSASHESGQVKIVIEDDGRGIDRSRVLRKAIEKGLITAAGAEKVTERDVIGLLMMPGFSTVDQISDVSGRGVGMDVVRTNVESLGGQIEIESEFGFGTSVQLRLPLTLAIIPSLIVGANGTRFAVPQASIVELVWVRADDETQRVQSLHGALTLRLRERLLPLIKVDDVLSGRTVAGGGTPRVEADTDRKDRYILVLRTGTENYGLIVDELFESEEIVVKPLPHFLKGIDCFAGTTILGDGSVTMILDPSGVATRAGLRFAAANTSESATSEGTRHATGAKRPVILFAGSPTEQYLVPQEQVLRLERVNRAALQRAGGRDYICYRGVGLPIVRLESFLPVEGVPDFSEEVYLLIPRMVQGRAVEPSAGILVWRILDALDLELNLQEPLYAGPGVKGATLVDGVLTTMLDPVAVVQAAYPRKERAA